ncbi:hypothetical protein GYMLUDRAFT_65823 [Collybiopsis luxurians FD-317 M1]|nr:hypothetical protein GYMLUDRAFT_65823 [Collybiopsis luxurians FD-317 M1]
MVYTDVEDEYAMYDDFSDLTEEQLAQLDAASSSALAPASSSLKTISHVQIELEGSPSAGNDNSSLQDVESTLAEQVSPLQQFRRNILSVTDLVSPAWCEVQFNYGLLSQRHRRLKDRPASFVTEQGTEIFVDKVIAAAADKTMKKGKSVHKRLEREIRPEEIQVQITTEEERWGLRVINMIDCIDSLLLLGCAREMPVFGVIEGNIVLGVIDEVVFTPDIVQKKRQLQSPLCTPQKPKRIRTSSSQLPITKFFSSDTHTSLPINRSGTLHLIDTKTRRNNSLPRDEDAYSSRLQLMLYHRMFSYLIGSSFDFPSFWVKLGLDATAPFSQKFLAQTFLAQEGECLNKLANLWLDKISQLNGAEIDSTLQLVYRSQSQHSRRRRKDDHSLPGSSREEIEIARAVEASLRDVQMMRKDEKKNPGREAGNLMKDPELLLAIEQSSIPRPIGPGFDAQAAKLLGQYDQKPVVDSRQVGTSQQTDIIGTKEFQVDYKLLDEYLSDIMQWWNGKRKPRGVSLEHSGRCFTCEYRTGCEWREQKAKEIEDSRKRFVD